MLGVLRTVDAGIFFPVRGSQCRSPVRGAVREGVVSPRRVVVGRVRFFQVGGEWFADVLWSYGSPLAVDPQRLSRFGATAPPSTFVVRRRLDARQSRLLNECRGDAEHETYRNLFPPRNTIAEDS